MKNILGFLTKNPVMGALAGALVTAVTLLFLPEGIGYTVPEGVELSEPGLLDYGKLEAMVETADLWLMVAEQKGMILQKQEFQGDPDGFRTFLQEKGVRIIPV